MSGRWTKRLSVGMLARTANALSWGFQRMPVGWTSVLGRGLGLALYGLWSQRRRVAEENLEYAFPERSAAERRAIVRRHFVHLGVNLTEFLQFPRWQERIAPRIRLEGEELVRALVHKGQGFLVFIPHLGHWEVLAPLWPTLHPAPLVLVQRMPHPRLEALVRRCRGVTGLELVDRRGGLRRLVGAVRQGRPVGLLADQDAGPAGIVLPFFGRPASCEPSPATLARRLGVPLLLNWTVREPDATHRVVFEEILVDPQDDRSTLQRLYARLETIIRQYPEQWLWIHRRWKSGTANPGS